MSVPVKGQGPASVTSAPPLNRLIQTITIGLCADYTCYPNSDKMLLDLEDADSVVDKRSS
jgi:hypothetical protein